MKNKKIILLSIFILLFIGTGIYCLYQYRFSIINNPQRPTVCTMEAKICLDGSSVGRTGPKCEFATCPNSVVYRNSIYGFELIMPSVWGNYSVNEDVWQGNVIDESLKTYAKSQFGPLVIIKNPQTNSNQQWQDIPIMVFTPDVWKLVEEEKVSVSAAPISPAKIGESAKYVFATPPRWYGFTDAIGWEEAIEIVKTFKTF